MPDSWISGIRPDVKNGLDDLKMILQKLKVRYEIDRKVFKLKIFDSYDLKNYLSMHNILISNCYFPFYLLVWFIFKGFHTCRCKLPITWIRGQGKNQKLWGSSNFHIYGTRKKRKATVKIRRNPLLRIIPLIQNMCYKNASKQMDIVIKHCIYRVSERLM